MPSCGLQSTFQNRRSAPDLSFPTVQPQGHGCHKAADFSPLSKTGAKRLTTSSIIKAVTPPRGLQSTFQNRRSAPDLFLPIITQDFSPGTWGAPWEAPGRLHASEHLTPWDLGQPPREYQPATSLGPSSTDRKTKNFKKITTSKTRVKSPMQGYPSTKIPTYSKKNAQALLTLNNYCHNLPLILTLNPK